MTEEQHRTASLALSAILVVTWIGFCAWAVWEQRQSGRRLQASMERLDDIAARSRPARSGEGTPVTVPAPSAN